MSFAFISRFHFQYSHHSTDGKWCLFAIQKITKANFATPTKQFLLADEEFLSKNSKNWAAWNYRTWVLRLSHVFISHVFIIHYSPHSTDRKWCLFAIRKIAFVIFATPTKQFLLADEEFSKNPHNSAAWNYRTWVLRLSHVFIFIIHIIRQTGSDVCFRFQR